MTSTTTFTDIQMAHKVDRPTHDYNKKPDGPRTGKLGTSDDVKKTFVPRKYNHLFAIHSKSRASCLTSQDAEVTPSFVGFRNLMVLVLGMNLRRYRGDSQLINCPPSRFQPAVNDRES